MRYIIIPARLASSRLPTKLMQPTKNGLVLGRTIANALPFVDTNTKVVVAVESPSIRQYVRYTFPDVICVPTEHTHPNGTSRVFEVANQLCKRNHDIVVNLQGDMAVIDPKAIERCLKPNLTIKTAYYPCTDQQKIADPNNVKVVTNNSGYANYFSRSVIPYKAKQAKIHVGVYGYTFSLLTELMKNQYKVDDTHEENLEQLSWLNAGYKIQASKVKYAISIDTEDDLKELNEYDINHR